jgi:predicted glutamine amidotransferase
MCVIIDKPAGVTMPWENVKQAALSNPDGWGVMWIDPKTGNLEARKGLFSSDDAAGDEFLEIYKLFKNTHAVFHLRVMTHGSISKENCHPFQITNKKEHGKDLYFMHNGTIYTVDDKVNPEKKSDTSLFNDQFLQPILKGNPDAVFLDPVLTMIDRVIGQSRLLFLADDGRIARLGSWSEYEGHIVSNTHSFHIERKWNNWMNGVNQVITKPPADTAKACALQIVGTTEKVVTPPETDTKTRAEEMATKVKEQLKKAAVVRKALEEEVDAAAEAEEDNDFDAFFSVGTRAVHESQLTTSDLMLMDSGDIYDLICDFPERAHDLVIDLLADLEFASYSGTSVNKH